MKLMLLIIPTIQRMLNPTPTACGSWIVPDPTGWR